MKFFHAVVWDKSARGNGLGWRYRRNYEFVMVAHRASGKLLWADEAVAIPNIFRTPPVPNDDHPTTKPVALVEHFLKAHSSFGATVLDPFMGSGTTGVAAVKNGRKFVGIEIDPRHFETACKRIERAYAQGDLFIASPSPKPEQMSLV
jgi:site-specific DNA-methyltransferase (adenine-specific)